ncbi:MULTISPECIES: hypothetical protein [unclassified Gordonia (in: high G+C Gram-positive bacteria)]|uniref:hypothetical protein n=1 Tax=unclassified Gordonia (in: high G+C Gram-positive bacteria) TaxID=2657482 RepID=UPI001F108201|nr:hypothetical protein [Gordonia sp. ABSL49_1]MCH5643224.1 hypothetical protein [Gordonia sp. ABSL49_1]
MKRTYLTSITAAMLAASAITVAAGSSSADPFGSASGSLDSGSAALGSSSKKPQHYGKLGRPDAPNGVKSINVWVYTPNKTPEISPSVYPRNTRIGVKWNSTIDAGNVIDGNECKMSVVLSGPKIPKKAAVTKTADCTAVKSYQLKTAGDYKITVTDGVSGASNSIKFTLQ